MWVVVAGLGCGRVGFDSLSTEGHDAGPEPVCTSGEACPLTGTCYAGSMVCAPMALCTADQPLAAGTTCSIGTCAESGVCESIAGTAVSADVPSPQLVGLTVAIDGTTLVTGAFNPSDGTDPGDVVVFQASDSGWVETQRIVPADSSAFDGFGSAVALDGDTLLVGARYWGEGDQGAIYVFENVSGTWEEKGIITITGSLELGAALAIDGTRAVASADYTVNGDSWGSAYVLERDQGGTWASVATLTSPGGDRFGYSVAIEGDRVVVGSLWTVNTQGDGDDTGAAHVFERQEGGSWVETATLFPPAVEAPSYNFAAGSSVSLSGNLLAVGDQMFGIDDRDEGAVTLWELSEQTWNPQVRLTEAAPERDARFGRSLVLDGERLVVSSTSYDECEIRLSVFRPVTMATGTEWRQIGRLAPESLGCIDGEAIGGMIVDLAVAVSGDRAVVGYPVGDGFNGDGMVVPLDLTGL